jgi:CRP-like cAMP-binding protein
MMSRVTEAGSTFDVLQAYLLARASVTEEELAFIKSLFIPKRLCAHDCLQRAGSVAKYSAFVVHGCLRSYAIDAEGKEHTVKFAPETWWVADTLSMTSGAPSQYFIEALEDTDLLLIDGPSHEKIVATVPGYADAFRKGLQRHAAAKDQRILDAISASAQERYLQFLKTYPSLATRVPQHMLASYLGVSPETVSRIRAKLAKK